jgi:hypothetical protein
MVPPCEHAPDYVNLLLSCERCDFHGMLTAVGFAGILTFGVFVSRYLRYRHWWWGLHLLIQAIGLAFVLAGLVVAIQFMGSASTKGLLSGASNDTWRLVHWYLGYVTVGFLLAQTLLGVFTYFSHKMEGQRLPAFPDRIHWALNWITLVLAYASIFSGLWVMLLPWYYKLIFGGYTASILLLSVFLDIATYNEIRTYKVRLEPEFESRAWDGRGNLVSQHVEVRPEGDAEETRPLVS